jgi:hypothetical protein
VLVATLPQHEPGLGVMTLVTLGVPVQLHTQMDAMGAGHLQVRVAGLQPGSE